MAKNRVFPMRESSLVNTNIILKKKVVLQEGSDSLPDFPLIFGTIYSYVSSDTAFWCTGNLMSKSDECWLITLSLAP